MAFHLSPPRKSQNAGYSPPRTSPLRLSSNASTNSSAYSGYSNPFPPSRTSTISSSASSGYSNPVIGHKRGLSEAEMGMMGQKGNKTSYNETGSSVTYKNTRQSLRPLPQPPVAQPPPKHRNSWTPTPPPRHEQSDDEEMLQGNDGPSYSQRPISRDSQTKNFHSLSLSHADHMAASSTHIHHAHTNPHASIISPPALTDLEKSSTGYLRTLSKFAQGESSEDFSITSPVPSVVGLHGRRQLKRTDSTRASNGNSGSSYGTGYAFTGRNWMDQQRQFLQAYEYLCHIGEAKEWIEDIIKKPIPPVVQLEEALRDGVTLAEIVQALTPDRTIRIFHHPKLQYRHSDNIAAFFRYLAYIELPELFRFELIDLYDKKNIPKVIYCIHALSWLLYRNGIVSFRIGNLVGQLKFEDHELEAMQKGLDKAGINMPSFSGMGASFGAEPEPEPVESDEDRIDRELSENEGPLLDLQSQIRGGLLRNQLHLQMQSFWDVEEKLIEFQSRLRGDWAREIAGYHRSMRNNAIDLQSAVRGYLVRCKQIHKQQNWIQEAPRILLVQSLIRGKKVREETKLLKAHARREESSIRSFQATIRGALARKQFDDQYEEAHHTEEGVAKFQAAVRGMLERHSQQQNKAILAQCQHSTKELQAVSRAMAVRSKHLRQGRELQNNVALWRALQAVSRGSLQRSRLAEEKAHLSSHSDTFTVVQAVARGKATRTGVQKLRSSLLEASGSILAFQAMSRAFLHREHHAADMRALKSQVPRIITLQALIRACLFNQRQAVMFTELESHLPQITELQALWRAMLLRSEVGDVLSQLEDEEHVIEALQAAARGSLVRKTFAEKMRFFKENMEKVVKVQSFVRGKLQGQAYKSLTCGKNPPVGTVKGFVHLLNDSDFDFDEEVEFERLRKTVVQHVRQNEMADQYITQLDIKIALLVKNKITLDEVVKHQKHFGANLLTTDSSSKDAFDLKALNKNSRRKLEQYQELFFVLQTQPQYLARLFKRIREQATAEKECDRNKHLMMGLFGYAQKGREEYYLLRLITRSIQEEVEGCQSLQDYLRGNFFWAKVFGAYAKSPRDRKYMRDILGFLIKENVIDNPELDLESDPVQIYYALIEDEQLRTGQRSQRPRDIDPREAIQDPETKRTFIAHLVDLRELTDLVFASLGDLLHKMPYGIRYISQQMFQSLCCRFPHEEPGHVLQIVGHWLWKSYLQPALLEPDRFGVIDHAISPLHKKNLAEIAKVFGQVAAGRLFGVDGYLHPLNNYVSTSIARLGEILGSLIDVPDAETQFDIDEFNDLYAKTKPTLYIKMADIFSIHQLVTANLTQICPGHEDMLRDVIRELGSAKNNENELMSVSTSEICLTLNPKLHDMEDPDAEVKAHFMETKRCILYIIRVQSGANLMEIMIKPITMEDEERWRGLVRDELSVGNRKRGAYAEANTLIDIASMSYAELKATALENIVRLEQYGRLTRHNHYQDLLNAIAVDIRTKHKRRVQRQRELEGVRLTLGRLNDQAVHLDEQLKTYNDYIEQAMVTLQNKKGKSRFLIPFSKQWEHQRELKSSGRVPKFGSFKYSALELANRGILLSWQGYSERQWGRLDLTISSNEIGVFSIEGSNGSITIPGASANTTLDDLLQAQYNGTQHLEFFGGQPLQVSVKHFVHLIMRKFYKDGDS